MTIVAKVIEDSINPYNRTRITTVQVSYPRFIHAELMTHRVFSRNASSSRAIPVNKMLGEIWKNPAMPIHWGANQPGMQADQELTGFKLWFTKKMWTFSARTAVALSWLMNKVASPHKQIVNRITESFSHIHVIITSTEWENFFELRDHPDAQPEIRELAQHIRRAMDESKPNQRTYHLPYVSSSEREKYSPLICMQLSTARCARVSYLTHDGKNPSFDQDMKLFNRLVGSRPRHFSPTEHQATAVDNIGFFKNFKSWRQFRADIEKQDAQYR